MSSMDTRWEHGDAAPGATWIGSSAASAHTVAPRLVACLLAVLAVASVTLLPAMARAQGEPAEADVAVEGDYYEDTDPSAVTEFRDVLEPHGTWVDDPVYGTVWVPSTVVVGADFRPYYTAGRWAVADDGSWVWVSDYDWGYIPFHYGRWVWIDGRGWAWIPGRRYAPAWVVWRVGEPGWDYVGWAPMGPSFIWVNGFAVAYWHVGVLPFWFVPGPWLFHHHWHHHVVPPHWHARVAGHTHVHGGSRYAAHPTAGPAGGRQGASPTSGSPTGSRLGSAGGARPLAVGSTPPTSPTFEEARIPARAQPTSRVAVDSRATSIAKRPAGSAAASRSGASAGRFSGTGPAGRVTRSSARRAPSSSAAMSGANRRPSTVQGERSRASTQRRPWAPPSSNRTYGTPSRQAPSRWQPPARSGTQSTHRAPSQAPRTSSWGRSPSRSSSSGQAHRAPSRSSSPSRSFSRPSSPSRSYGPAPSTSSKKQSSSSKKSSGSRSSGKSRGSSRSRRR